jgi:bla regulator protein BlaR1
MMPSDLSPLANHLWQSTLCSVALWLLTVILKENRAAVRYWLWLGASVKFLVPFSLFVSMSRQLGFRTLPAAVETPWSVAGKDISTPFATIAPSLQAGASTSSLLPAVLFVLWLFGFVVSLSLWLRSWRRMRNAQNRATQLTIDFPIPVMGSPTPVEPGVLGIFRPVVLLPAGITDRLTPRQLQSILEHELCHVRRRDNLTAALHMLVEAVFWFYPLMYWIRARLIEERERACDEAVLEAGSDAEVYAEGLLNVCKFYLESPLPCVAGIGGADLKRRVVRIMTKQVVRKLDFSRKLLLGATGVVVIGVPIVLGLLTTELGRAKSQADNPAAVLPIYNTVSIKPTKPGSNTEMLGTSSGNLSANGATLQMLIGLAYGVSDFQIVGGPNWLSSERYDVAAKAGSSAAGELQGIVGQRMIQALLEGRFKLAVHRETRQFPVYALTVAGSGPKIQESKAGIGLLIAKGQLISKGGQMGMLVDQLSRRLGRPVLDQTGLTGNYDFMLQWRSEDQDSDAPSIFTAVGEQLGLKLESQQLPVDVLAIDHAEKPAEN